MIAEKLIGKVCSLYAGLRSWRGACDRVLHINALKTSKLKTCLVFNLINSKGHTFRFPTVEGYSLILMSLN